MSDKTQKGPVQTLRDGAIKAAIWRNESENGVFFNVTFARTYKDNAGELNDADSYSGTQLLRIARLADKAYEQTRKLTAADKSRDNEETGEA